uniref:DNA methylase n=1 Tax=Candidatus Kentrum sp. SD TaxID=2126332 RepID=A0A451BJR2_9GAMM|nr:MAG: hypothetical protein BECKSD772D_GA0070982_101716 [Candidatus Kentron sp. SD]
MARKKKTDTNRSIESYRHQDKQRVNNPPVGLVTSGTDPDAEEKRIYAFDPHLDPEMRWDGRPDARLDGLLANLAALARQRLMTAVFDYYHLAYPGTGVGGGFVYKTVPHVTLKSIANNPDIREGMTRAQIDAAIARHAPQETLYDQPRVDKTRTRVTGPFTVEAVPAPAVKTVDSVSGTVNSEARDQAEELSTNHYAYAMARSGETLRQGEWRDELLRAGIRGKAGQHIRFARLEPLPGCRYLHADGEVVDSRIVSSDQWSVNSEEKTEQPSTDHSSLSTNHYSQVTILGFDYYNTRTGGIESGEADQIAVWLLDTDYDGRSLYPRQVFFPMAGAKEGWARLAKNLKAEIDEERIEAYRGAVSLPFEAGEHRRIAVKIVDNRGIESLKVVELDP